MISAAYADGTTTVVGVSYSQYFKTVGYSSGTIAVEGGTVSYTPKDNTDIILIILDTL